VGDDGLVSTMIVRPTEDDEVLEIENWVMSCRVFGRELEFESMDIAVEAAKERGAGAGRRLHSDAQERRDHQAGSPGPANGARRWVPNSPTTPPGRLTSLCKSSRMTDNFIVAVEMEFGVKFKVADIESFANVGAIVKETTKMLA
jgi:hypothetical protein